MQRHNTLYGGGLRGLGAVQGDAQDLVDAYSATARGVEYTYTPAHLAYWQGLIDKQGWEAAVSVLIRDTDKWMLEKYGKLTLLETPAAPTFTAEVTIASPGLVGEEAPMYEFTNEAIRAAHPTVPQALVEEYAGYIRNLYSYYFQREPDEGGFNFYFNQLVSGTATREQVQQAFLNGEQAPTPAVPIMPPEYYIPGGPPMGAGGPAVATPPIPPPTDFVEDTIEWATTQSPVPNSTPTLTPTNTAVGETDFVGDTIEWAKDNVWLVGGGLVAAFFLLSGSEKKGRR